MGKAGRRKHRGDVASRPARVESFPAEPGDQLLRLWGHYRKEPVRAKRRKRTRMLGSFDQADRHALAGCGAAREPETVEGSQAAREHREQGRGGPASEPAEEIIARVAGRGKRLDGTIYQGVQVPSQQVEGAGK